ncbi:MAG: hypothetical protein NWF00_08030 [Candidatus Bathyarchaeota archaeon]|nr:hypothetical protein [Candidatus Bathyarchaeota archaeon]
MGARAVIIGATWFAIMIIVMMYISVGGLTLATSIATTLLIAVAFIVTFGVAFGLQEHQA